MAKLMLSPKRALLHVQSAVKHVTGAGSAVKGVARALCECQHRRGACWQALAGSVVDVDRCVGVGTRVRRSCTRTRCVELVGASVSGRSTQSRWGLACQRAGDLASQSPLHGGDERSSNKASVRKWL